MLRLITSAILFTLLVISLPYWLILRREFGTRFVHALVLANLLLIAIFYVLHTPYAQAQFPALYQHVSHGLMINTLGICTGLCIAHLFRHWIIPIIRFQTTPGEREPWSIGRPIFIAGHPGLTNTAILIALLFVVWIMTGVEKPPNQLGLINLICVFAYIFGLFFAAIGGGTLAVSRR
jgi:hypothetical protein